MAPFDPITALAALAHDRRLEIFRLLVRAGPEGLAAGRLAAAMQSRPNTLSSQLNQLVHAGLIAAQRDGRSIIYRAQYARMAELIAYLIDDCCGNDLQMCAPLAELSQRAACCAPANASA